MTLLPAGAERSHPSWGRPACRIAGWARVAGVVLALGGLAACGGGGGAGAPPAPSAALAQQCAPSNPYLGDATSPVTLASLDTERRWVRQYVDEAYLWYREVPAADPLIPDHNDPGDVAGSLERYFDALRTPELTASGKRKDEFSFVYPTRAWDELSRLGASLGYGAEWFFGSATPPRGIRIAYVEPGSPAAAAGWRRGDRLLEVDGIAADDPTPAGVDALNAALFPARTGLHRFSLERGGVPLPPVTLAATTVVRQPVLLARVIEPTPGDPVGVIVFNEHLGDAERQMIDAMRQMAAAGVRDLVIDLRYNGGGFLYIASQVAAMITAPDRTAGRVFERSIYNDKRVADNAAAGTPFYTRSCIPDATFSRCTLDEDLPRLGLARVFVIAGAGTCSASEALVNGLRGVGVQVSIVGATSCGKPFGFTARDNCGLSYFPIEFQGVNDQGFGDFADGFAPTCRVDDDFGRELGDPTEGRLAAALVLRATGVCPPGTAVGRAGPLGWRTAGFVARSPLREQKIATPRLPVR